MRWPQIITSRQPDIIAQASKHYEEKDYAHAAHQALIAHDHTRRAIHHGNEAGKYHAEQHSNASSK
jgi:hypothetical protein